MIFYYWLISLVWAQEVSLRVQQDKLYSGLPFVLTILASDFEEEPVPEVAEFKIHGCDVQFLGVEPQISRQVSIVNGQFSEAKDVKYAYRYRVLAEKKGHYQIPSISVSQDTTVIASKTIRFSVQEVPKTSDMEIFLSFEEGQYWVGQEIPVHVDLYLRKDISNQEISVPLFDLFPTRSTSSQARSLGLLTKFGEIHLPISQEKLTWKGKTTTRIRLSAISELNRAGTFEIEPARIFADVAMRQVRGAFGIARTQYSYYQAADKPKKLDVKPLPLQNRPKAFSGAVGEGYSLEVSASRTVVGVGEPISLQFMLKGDGKLDGIQLPSLEAMGLDSRIFALPSADIIGVKQEDGSKQYDVNIHLKSTSAREIPALEFPFFNPKLGKYQIVRSEPIALSVKETEKISSTDVFSAREKSSPKVKQIEGKEEILSVDRSGVDLSLSSSETSLQAVLNLKTAGWIAGIVHLLGLLFLGFSQWWSKGKESREEREEQNAIVNRLKRAIQQAEELPVAQSAKELGQALRAWEQEFQENCQEELASIEIQSFAPEASTAILSTAIINSIKEKLKKAGKYLFPFIIMLGFGVGQESFAEELSIQAVQQEYKEALELENRNERLDAFSTAQKQFARLVEENPDCPELLTDWGNAALGASDFGVAAFAYHEALRLQPRLSRAKQNMQWIESQLPDWAQSTTVSDPLLWGEWFSIVERLFLLMGMFVLLCFTLHRKRFNLSVVLVLLWCSLGLSISMDWFEPPKAFVFKTEAILRAADSNGAPALMSKEIPPGTKLEVLKSQGNWIQVNLDSGEKGWLPKSKVLTIL